MTKIMLIAGEASGDNHGASLIQALKAQRPDIDCYGIGSQKMKEAGCRILFDSQSIAVMGLFEVIRHFSKIKQAWKIAKNALLSEKPDCVILIDYPGFNLRFAKQAKKAGCPVLYYVSPQVWAWHRGRLKYIKQYIDHMALILPFEKKIYDEAGIPATYVGSPLFDQIQVSDKMEARHKLSLSHSALIIGLLPGSRKTELARLLPELIDSAEILSQRYPHTQFVIPLANTLKESDIWPYLDDSNLPIVLIKRNSHLAMSACDVLIGSSGTATLEAAILGRPMVIIYKMNALTFALAKRLVKIQFIGLPNLLANKAILPELIQNEAQSLAIADAACRFIDNEVYEAETQAALLEVTQILGQKGCSKRLATLALKLADKSKKH